MTIAITGASGLIGRALSQRLTDDGHRVIRLVRSRNDGPDTIYWSPSDRVLERSALEHIEVVVHLAGENLAAGRWTEARKKAIRDSRVVGTRLLAEALASLSSKPKLFLSASATGYYGDRGEELLDETASRGEGFLAELVEDWEAASLPAARVGIRTVNVRIGVVLARGGGALAKMLPVFRLGLGGKLGSGRQYMSWIALEDLVAAVLFIIRHENLAGPVNATAPHPVTNLEFTQRVGRRLHRPTILPVPAFALRLLFGEMAEETVLAGARVVPGKLTEAGFAFQFPRLETALQAVL